MLGYILNPACLIFGPWIAFPEYMHMATGSVRQPLSFRWIVHTLATLLVAIMFLLMSSCGASHYIPKMEPGFLSDSALWGSYKAALYFRCSHYYVCFLSESTCLLAGIYTLDTNHLQQKVTNDKSATAVSNKANKLIRLLL